LPGSGKTGKVKKALEWLLSPFRPGGRELTHRKVDKVEEINDHGALLSRLRLNTKSRQKKEHSAFSIRGNKKKGQEEVHKLNVLQKFAYNHLSPSLPTLPGYRDAYEQAGLPLVYESYLASAFLLSLIVAIPTLAISLVFENRTLKIPLLLSSLGSVILAFVAFAISMLVWLLYPLERRRSFKAKLERQLAYSFGILGALSASGIGVERLFERLAATETNPVLAELARRFLRDVKVFGLDTETALHEVATHSPSVAFSKMLDSMAVAYRTTGSMHDLVMFESTRLFSEKKDKLKKNVSDLALMSELYITLVVVGPIIFIVMLTIFMFLPTGSSLPSPIILINILVFLGIPSISAGFILLLDSMVGRM
jgi:archaeal flagellar protein FlaJ